MEIVVKVTKILDAQKFVSKRDGSEVVKHTFIGETQGQYPKNIAFGVMGEEKFKQMALMVGKSYNVSFDIESREWQGKWFTEASAWRAMCMDGQTQAPTQAQVQTVAQPAPETRQESEKTDDLPF